MDVFEHFINNDHGTYVGHHIIVDFWGVANHADSTEITNAFAKACEDAGATVLFKHCHHFGAGCGTTGVIVLSESHASWHHYPEVNMIAIDIFMCGSANPEHALPRLKDFWKPKIIDFTTHRRGIVEEYKLPKNLKFPNNSQSE